MGFLADSLGGTNKPQDKSWFDTLMENVGNTAEQIPKAAQGAYNLVVHDLPETAKNYAAIPGTAATGALEGLGVDSGTAEKIGGNLGMLTGVGAIQRAADFVTGAEHPSDINRELLAPHDDSQNRERFTKLYPAVAGLEQGFEDTGQRAGQSIQAAASSTPILSNYVDSATNPYVDAYKQGKLADIAVPDAANWALAADLGAGALSETSQAARAGATAAEGGTAVFNGALDRAVGTRLAPYADTLDTAQQALAKGAGAGNVVAGAPINAVTAPVRVPLRWARQAATESMDYLPTVAHGGPVQSAIDRTAFAQGVGQRLEPIGRLFEQNAMRSSERGQLLRDPAARTALDVRAGRPALETQLGLAPEEAQAVQALRLGKINPQSAAVIDTLSGANELAGRGGLEDVLAQVAPDITPETYGVLQQHYAGTNPALSERLQAGLEAWDPIEQRHAEMRLEGYGEKRPAPTEGPAADVFARARAEEQGTAPMEAAVERAIADPLHSDFLDKNTAAEINDLNRTLQKAGATKLGQGEHADVLERLNEIRDQLRADPKFAPPALRPVVQFHQDLKAHAAAELENLPESTRGPVEAALNELTTNLPDMTAAGQVPENVGYVKMGAPPEGQQPFLTRQPGPEPLKRTVGSERVRATTTANLDPVQQWIANVKDIADRHTNAVIQERVDQIGRPASNFGDDAATAAEAARKQGYVPYDPVDWGRPLKPESIQVGGEGESVFVPKPFFEAMSDLRKRTPNGELGKMAVGGYDALMRGWKKFILPYSPKWVVGNLFGNAFMLPLSTKGAYSAQNIADTFGLMRHPDLMAERVKGAGLVETIGSEKGLLDPANQLKMTPTEVLKGGFVKKAAELGYKGNQVVDDFGHIAAMNARRLEGVAARANADQLLADGRISEAMHETLVGKIPTDQQIVEQANKAMGDFQNLSAIEREGVKRVLPFYAWAKHITRLAAKLPFESPYRVAWTLNVGDLFGDNYGDRPDFLKNAIDMGGGRYLKIPYNPFPGGTEGSPFLTPQNLAGSLSPAIQWPLAAWGLNTGRGRMLSRAPDGTDQSKMGFIGFGPLAGYLAQQLPQTRLALDTVRPDVLRYDTGQPHLVNGKTVPTATESSPIPGLSAPLASFLTGAAVDQPDIPGATKRTNQQKKTLTRSALKYDARRSRLGV